MIKTFRYVGLSSADVENAQAIIIITRIHIGQWKVRKRLNKIVFCNLGSTARRNFPLHIFTNQYFDSVVKRLIYVFSANRISGPIF